jgi:hypothetical protein
LEYLQVVFLLFPPNLDDIERKNQTEASFLDLNGNLLNTAVVANSSNILHADFDQKRKELVLLSHRSEIKNFAVRLVVATLKGGISNSSFHVISRIQSRIPENLRNHPLQLISQDASGCTLVLLNSGCIICLETSSLEILWHIDPERFVEKPQRLFADKFGPSFALLCQNPLPTGSGQLELWIPPSNFQQINSSLFERYVIPLQDEFVHLHIESIGGDYHTSIVLQYRQKAHLWMFNPATKQLGSQCLLNFTGLELAFAPFQTNSGIGSFLSAAGLPGCKVLYVGFSGYGVCTIALHRPCAADKNWMLIDQRHSFFDLHATQFYQDESHGGRIEEFFGNQASLGSTQPPTDRQAKSSPTRLPSVATMNDSISVDEEGKSRVPYVNSPNNNNRVCSLKPKHFPAGILFFCPASSLSRPLENLSDSQKNSLLQFVLPTGLALLSDISFHKSPPSNVISHIPSDADSGMEIQRVCRYGFYPAFDPIPQSSSLNFKIVRVACRSSMLVLITDLKEGFVFQLDHLFNPRSDPVRPIRLELEIRPQAHVTSLMVSDILIRMEPNQMMSEGQAQFTSLEGSGVLGTHILTMVGDSDGYINFSVCSLTAVLHQGSIRAHNSPIISILSTGDASRNLWKVGTQLGTGPLKQVQPKPCPGSSIVSVSQDGELKVWQPIFSQQNSARSHPSQILSIYQLSWKISGLVMVLNRNVDRSESPQILVTSSFIDPTCLTCVIGSSDGVLTQWPLPGLVNRSNGKVQIGKSSIWSCKRHRGSLTHASLSINLPRTSVNIVPFDPSKQDVQKLCHLIYDNTSIDSKEECHIGYTVDQLRRIAENTLLVISSVDLTISLWRFIVSKAIETPEFIDSLSKRSFSQFKYMSPVHCRIFTLSSTPELSYCYPLLSSSLWRVSALVNGIVIHLAEETKLSLSKSSGNCESLEPVSNFEAMESLELVDSMTVLCHIYKPHSVSDYSSTYGVHTEFSWEIFDEWQNDFLLLPDLSNSVSEPVDDIDHGGMTTSLSPKLTNGSSLKNNLVELGDVSKSVMKCTEKNIVQKTIPQASHKGQKTSVPSKEFVSVFHNGIYMKVPQTNISTLEKTIPKVLTRRPQDLTSL